MSRKQKALITTYSISGNTENEIIQVQLRINLNLESKIVKNLLCKENGKVNFEKEISEKELIELLENAK